MTTELEDVLLVKNKNDNDAMKRLMDKYHSVIYNYAKHIDPMHLTDAMQDGNIGLFTACRAFDPSLGYKFSSLAFPYIHGTILRGLQGRRSVKYNSAKTLSELSQDEDYLRLSNPVSLDNLNLKSLEAFSEEIDMDKPIITQTVHERFDSLLDSVCSSKQNPELSKKALSLRFGLEDGKVWKVDDICSKLDIKKGTVKYHISKAKEAFANDEELSELYQLSY